MENQESTEIRASLAPRRHARGWRRGKGIFTVAVAFVMLATATVVTAYAVSGDPDTYSFFAKTDISRVGVDPEGQQVELGLTFTSSKPGTLTAVRFLKVKGDPGPHRVTVWSSRGQAIATATSVKETSADWQEVALAAPVGIEAGQEYTVSYNTTRYRATESFFAKSRTVKAGPLRTVGGGVFAYGQGTFPTASFNYSNYWVDVVVKPTSGTTPAQSATATVSVAPSASSGATTGPSASATPSPSATTTTVPPAEAVKLDLPRVAWEGGPSYYASFPEAAATGYTDADFFPTGVWFESVQSDADVAKDKAAGLNMYVELTENSDIATVRRDGMRALTSWTSASRGDESVGWLLTDEADMWGGAGDGEWTGKYPGENGDICKTKEGCGYDVLSTISDSLPTDDRMRYANYGKGVMFWQTDGEAAKFVNRNTDIVSNDVYWYTDPNVCTSTSEGLSIGVPTNYCRRSANYGLTMDKMRELDGLDGKRQPVYAFIEVGHPFTEDDSPTITGDQIAGATMSSLIHEARGIIYFNHNFGGSCISQHVLRDACGTAVLPTVTELNARIAQLAPVLNTQSYQWSANSSVDTMLKAYGDSYYLFAMPGRFGGTGSQKLKLPDGLSGAKAEVLFENRSVSITDGAIQDTFSKEYSYHIYKITP
ncbi:DUF4082 domain-containing protein [Actinoplanes sp. NPDC051851]|uniref:DUF4082 domain-containing protein n=1 Tax=Actinoplanes sp. NPDC051851 TaxID=3154753 RepID=UPI003415122B